MRLLILCAVALLGLSAAEPAKDVKDAKDAKDAKDKPKKVEEAAITPQVREFLSAIYLAGPQPTQEQCDRPLSHLQAKGPYDYDTPTGKTAQRVNLSLMLKRQGQPIGLVELGHWNYLNRAERVWYMVPCQHGMLFMHMVTGKLPDGKTPIVLLVEFSENITSVPRELVHPDEVVIKAPETEADKPNGDKAPADKPGP